MFACCFPERYRPAFRDTNNTMLRLTLLSSLALVCFCETNAQPIAPKPTAVATLHANRMRVHGLQPGALAWQLHPVQNLYQYGNPPISIDFDGSDKPCAGMSNAGLWIGGKDSAGQIRVSCQTEYPYPFTAGPYSGHWPTDSLNALRWDRFFGVSRLELEMHRADWADNGVLDNPLPNVLAWPGRGNPHFETQVGFPLPADVSAPFRDVNQDGVYNPYDGDYPHPPALVPDVLAGQMLWTIFNDAHGKFHGVPVGVDVQFTAWALDCSGDNLLNETVFFSYTITNRSGTTLDSVAVALWNDPQIGALTDDFSGTNAPLNSTFAYNNSNLDTNLYTLDPNRFGINPPAVSMTYLNQPLYKSMFHYIVQICDPPSALLEPSEPEEFFHNLHGRWRDGSPLVYGGDGHYGQGQPTDYAFPGDPNNPADWTMFSQYQSCYFMAGWVPSMYVGHFPPGAAFSFDVAFAYHRGEGLNNLQNVTYGFDRIEQLQVLYDDRFVGACPYTPCTDDCVWPGDLDRDGIVRPRDILPLGTGWGTTGEKRPGPVTWAPHQAPDWGLTVNGDYDFKYLDANGDGMLDSLDGLVVQSFLGQRTPHYVPLPDVYSIGDELWLEHISAPGAFGANPNNVQPDKIALVRVRSNAAGLFGVAFEMEVDTNYWTITSVNMTHASVSRRLMQTRGGIVDAAMVLADPSTVVVPGNSLMVATLRSKALPDSLPDTTFVRIKNIRGIRADGSEIPLGSNELRYCFGGDCPPYVGTAEVRHEAVAVFPNPAQGRVMLLAPGLAWDRVEAFDLEGRLLRRWDEPGRDTATLDLSGTPPGWALIRVQGRDWVGMQRVLVVR